MKLTPKRIGIFCALVLVVVAAVVGALAMREHELRVRVAACLRAEKDWILENQRADGAIYLNLTGGSGAGDVNPYFSAIAARGLIAGDVSARDVEAAGAYLAWHTKQVIAYAGAVPNYVLQDADTPEGSLVSTGAMDSVDAYLAQYLLLLEDYARCGGNLDLVGDWAEAARIALATLAELVDGGVGLTQTTRGSGVCYLMDNVEVAAALSGLSALPASFDVPLVRSADDALWNSDEGRFEVGFTAGTLMQARDLTAYYPDLMAQMFPLVYGTTVHGSEVAVLLAERESQAMADVSTSEGVKDWQPLLAHAYARAGQRDFAREMVFALAARADASRRYPYHAGNAGELCLACAALL